MSGVLVCVGMVKLACMALEGFPCLVCILESGSIIVYM